VVIRTFNANGEVATAQKLVPGTGGVTRLDGALGKKRVWRCSNLSPMFESELLWKKFTVLKKVRVIFLGLFGAPVVI